MTSLITNNNNIIICTDRKILRFNNETKNISEIEIPEIHLPDNLTKNQQEALKNEKPCIISSTFSKTGEYFSICTLNKQLVVYDSEFKVIKNIVVQRAASKVKFTPSNDIIVADKTGDVYLFKLKSDHNESEPLLGHLSMLLDSVVSDSEKYIITCDRDEKIRVSSFPNSYNIVSFCLGHEEFVLNLEFLNSDILVSSSGDGTVRFWNYLSGKQLKIINTNDYIKDKSLVEKFSEFMDTETVEVSSLPITNLKLQKFENFTVIFVSLYNFNAIQIYKVSNNLDIELMQLLNVEQLIAFDVSDKLYILTNKGIYIYEMCNDKLYELQENVDLEQFYQKYKDIFKNVSLESISVLYKRKYDNVLEYQERKKLRIENLKK